MSRSSYFAGVPLREQQKVLHKLSSSLCVSQPDLPHHFAHPPIFQPLTKRHRTKSCKVIFTMTFLQDTLFLPPSVHSYSFTLSILKHQVVLFKHSTAFPAHVNPPHCFSLIFFSICLKPASQLNNRPFGDCSYFYHFSLSFYIMQNRYSVRT